MHFSRTKSGAFFEATRIAEDKTTDDIPLHVDVHIIVGVY